MFLFLAMLLYAAEVQAHEFMHTPRVRRISLSKIKEQAAHEFSEQLQLSAEALQLIGMMQVHCAGQKALSEAASEIKQLKILGMRMQQCRSCYVDLLAQAAPKENPFEQTDLPLQALFGYLTQIIGCVQQRILSYVHEIFEDKSAIFVKEHTNRLPEVVKTVRLYTQDFKMLNEALRSAEKKLSGVSSAPISSSKEHESQISEQKA